MARIHRLVLLVCLLLFAGGWHWFEPSARRVMNGVESYQSGQYQQALDAFISAKGLAPDSRLLRYNTAATLLRLEKPQEALEEMAELEGNRGLPEALLHYNRGNALFLLQDYQKALESFKKSLMADPHDLQAKRNLELTLRVIREKQRQSSPPPQTDNPDNTEQEDQKNQEEDPDKNMEDNLNQYEKEQQKKQRPKPLLPIGLEKDW